MAFENLSNKLQEVFKQLSDETRCLVVRRLENLTESRLGIRCQTMASLCSSLRELIDALINLPCQCFRQLLLPEKGIYARHQDEHQKQPDGDKRYFPNQSHGTLWRSCLSFAFLQQEGQIASRLHLGRLAPVPEDPRIARTD